MLFNSYYFLFVFFPIVLFVFFIAGKFGQNAKLVTLLGASIVFYGWWDIRFLLLLGASILMNFFIGRVLSEARGYPASHRGGWILALSVALNLTVLGIFKYANFFVQTVNTLADTDFHLAAIILPLGISFFTFEQIGYLVDIHRGATYRADLLRYSVFVAFFPRLVAGPILRYNEIAPQFQHFMRRVALDDLAIGLTIFFIGLAKKSFLADGVAPYGTQVFAAAAAGKPVDFFLAWSGALAYTCQLYFDFSGYSDMAIGAARCFGIRFPMNFFSPYKSTSIIEFWRRWHITLSRFLRDYLYFSLGGSRRGRVRRYVNLLITMLLGGLWHGANWTFVAWGGLHGAYLMANHAWLGVGEKCALIDRFRRSKSGKTFGFTLTFLGVVVGWVLFRATSFGAAIDILHGMCGLHGLTLPTGLEYALRPVHGITASLGITFVDGSGTQLAKAYLWIVALLAIAFLLPSTQELLAAYAPVLEMEAAEKPAALPDDDRNNRPRFSVRWAIATGALAFLGIVSITRVSEFLYWQF